MNTIILGISHVIVCILISLSLFFFFSSSIFFPLSLSSHLPRPYHSAPGPASPEQDNRFSPDGRLPNGGVPDDRPEKAATIQEIRNVFGRMGFNDQEMVALSGGHALGHCHTDRSGYCTFTNLFPFFF